MNLPPTNQSPAEVQWQNRPERGSMFMLRIMAWISLRLGRPTGRMVLHLITLYFIIFSRAERIASRDYLERALGRKPTLPDHYKHVLSFANTIHDRIFLVNDRYDLFDITMHNEDIIHDTLTAGRGVFMLGAHLGSFEVIHAMSRLHPDQPAAMVMFEENARKINAMLSAINPELKQDIIPLGHIDTMIKVNDRLNDGTVISMLADRSLNNDVTLTAPFLGQDAEFPIGPFRMAALLKRPVVFMTGLYLGKNRYHIHFEMLADFTNIPAAERDDAIQTAINRYAELLEKYCHSAPYNWFNFFDFWQKKQPPESSGSGQQ